MPFFGHGQMTLRHNNTASLLDATAVLAKYDVLFQEADEVGIRNIIMVRHDFFVHGHHEKWISICIAFSRHKVGRVEGKGIGGMVFPKCALIFKIVECCVHAPLRFRMPGPFTLAGNMIRA